MKVNKLQLALKDLTLVLELDSNFYQAYYNRGTLLAQLGRLEKSKQDLTKAKALAQTELEQKHIKEPSERPR